MKLKYHSHTLPFLKSLLPWPTQVIIPEKPAVTLEDKEPVIPREQAVTPEEEEAAKPAKAASWGTASAGPMAGTPEESVGAPEVREIRPQAWSA